MGGYVAGSILSHRGLEQVAAARQTGGTTIRRALCSKGASRLLLGVLATLLVLPEAGIAQSTVRVVTYNIKHGRGLDDKVDLPRIAGVLRRLDADVITLQEVDNRTTRTGGVDQVRVLAELLGYRGFHGAHRPYQGGEYGNAVLTRLPVRGVRTHRIPPSGGSALTVHEVEVVVGRPAPDLNSGEGERTISVVSVHLAGTPEERLAQADSVTSFFAGVDHQVVLAGDFNGRPSGPVLRRLQETWRVLKKGGDPNTYPSAAPDREIDFVMVLPIPGVEVLEHRVVDERLASDHRPLLAVIRLLSRTSAE